MERKTTANFRIAEIDRKNFTLYNNRQFNNDTYHNNFLTRTPASKTCSQAALGDKRKQNITQQENNDNISFADFSLEMKKFFLILI